MKTWRKHLLLKGKQNLYLVVPNYQTATLLQLKLQDCIILSFRELIPNLPIFLAFWNHIQKTNKNRHHLLQPCYITAFIHYLWHFNLTPGSLSGRGETPLYPLFLFLIGNLPSVVIYLVSILGQGYKSIH